MSLPFSKLGSKQISLKFPNQIPLPTNTLTLEHLALKALLEHLELLTSHSKLRNPYTARILSRNYYNKSCI